MGKRGGAPKNHARANTQQEFFEHTVDEVAKLLSISKAEVYLAQRTGLEKVKDALLKDPSITHLLAHEADEKEITKVFKESPWCKVIRLVDGTIILKQEWFQKLKDKEANPYHGYTIT